MIGKNRWPSVARDLLFICHSIHTLKLFVNWEVLRHIWFVSRFTALTGSLGPHPEYEWRHRSLADVLHSGRCAFVYSKHQSQFFMFLGKKCRINFLVIIYVKADNLPLILPPTLLMQFNDSTICSANIFHYPPLFMIFYL